MSQIKVTIRPRLRAYLRALLESGLYGDTMAGTCRILIQRGIEKAISGGIIDKQSPEEK